MTTNIFRSLQHALVVSLCLSIQCLALGHGPDLAD
jgi:hypothetical protein